MRFISKQGDIDLLMDESWSVRRSDCVSLKRKCDNGLVSSSSITLPVNVQQGGNGGKYLDVYNKNSTNNKQILMGVKEGGILDWLDNVLIVSDGWPSLVFDVHHMAKRVWVSVATPFESFVSAMPKNVQIIKHIDVGHCKTFDWIFYQGSYPGLKQWMDTSSYLCSAFDKMILVLPKMRVTSKEELRDRWKWYFVRHSNLGGVTSSVWSIGVPLRYGSSLPTFSSLIPSYGLARSFRLVIKPDNRGQTVGPPETGDQLPDLVDGKDVEIRQFVLPCCLNATGWVSRKLVEKEISAVFDVPELLAPKLANGSLAFPYTKGCPGKVSQLVSAILLHILKREEPGSTLVKASEPNVAEVAVSNATQNQATGFLYFPSSDSVIQPEDAYIAAYGEKAAKNDDAEVPTHLWDVFLFRHYLTDRKYDPIIHGKALQVLREKFALRIYVKNVTKSFFRYLSATYGDNWLSRYYQYRKLSKVKNSKRKRTSMEQGTTSDDSLYQLSRDIAIGLDGLARVVQGSWWEWDFGSTLFFWRWPRDMQRSARDGYPLCIQGKLPKYRVKQKLPRDANSQIKMREKIEKVVKRGYIADGFVYSLINCFAVPKGESDIRLVYDGTKSKLNDALWAPNFFLPSVDSMLMWTTANTWHADLDLGEMFLNYFLDVKIRPYAGVDLTDLLRSEHSVWKRWERSYMGNCPSPYSCCKLFAWCVDMIHGDRHDPQNPYKWDSVSNNLPGSDTYNPVLPRMCKMWKESVAAELEPFVDDLRNQASSELECRLATSKAARILQYLGQQDAPRKYRPPHRTPGPWCGTFVASKDDAVWVYVSQEKWEKARTFIFALFDILNGGDDENSIRIDFKFLEKGRGFMVYFCRTYTSFTPHLKGLHLTLDSWRKGRDVEGWKVKGGIDKDMFDDMELDEELDFVPCRNEDGERSCRPQYFDTTGHPAEVSPVPRLQYDIAALKSFLSTPTPPWRFVRGKLVMSVQYGFGDASKAGFGASFELTGSKVWFRFGVWGSDEESNTSNFRELSNLVETLEERAKDPSFRGFELFIFTDNSTAESAFYRGTSSSPKLFELVMRLRKLELDIGCKINFVHVAGTRMIAQGSDGLSRGDLSEGVMKGESISCFIPLHLSALDRSPLLKEWITSWLTPDKSRGQAAIEFLSPEGWFERGHDIVGGFYNPDGIWTPSYKSGTFVWTPAPAAAVVAVEQLRRARLKREDSTHVFIVPRLMTPEFKRQLFRVSDLYIELPFDDTSNAQEPFWDWRGVCAACGKVKTSPQGLFCSNFSHGRGRWEACRKVWCGKCYQAPPDLDFYVHRAENEFEAVWIKHGDDRRFLDGIDGAFLLTPFQCDLCWFRNLEGRSPREDSFADERVLGYIRRVNLDIIWSRAPGTIASVKRSTSVLIQCWRDLGIKIDLPKIGPWPLEDKVGFRVALGQLKHSQRQGQNRKSHLQYDTVRKLRSALSHLHEAAASQHAGSNYSFRSLRGESLSLSNSPTESRLFKMFMQGLLYRMGRQTESNWGLDYRILLKIVKNLEEDYRSDEASVEDKRWLIMCGSFLLIGFVLALRGNECFMVESEGLQSHIKYGKEKVEGEDLHVIVPLLGRFKNEDGEIYHLMASVSTTSSGLPVRKWIERHVEVLAIEKRGMGPAFCDEKGDLINYGKMNAEFIKQVERVQEDHPELLDSSVDVSENFSIFRSLRKGSTARATDTRVPEPAIDLHNRWRTLEKTKGAKSTRSMRDYYTDLRLTLNTRLLYSKAL